MKVAIPIFGNRVSPRFDCAYLFLIIKIKDGKIINKEKIELKSVNPIERVNELIGIEVDMLICNAINDFTLRMLNSNGINVISWITGGIDEVIELFLKGELRPGVTFFPDGRRICRRVRYGRGRCKRVINDYNRKFYKEQ